MNGCIDWSAMDLLAEYLNVQDAESFMDGLLTLQDHARSKQDASNKN